MPCVRLRCRSPVPSLRISSIASKATSHAQTRSTANGPFVPATTVGAYYHAPRSVRRLDHVTDKWEIVARKRTPTGYLSQYPDHTIQFSGILGLTVFRGYADRVSALPAFQEHYVSFIVRRRSPAPRSAHQRFFGHVERPLVSALRTLHRLCRRIYSQVFMDDDHRIRTSRHYVICLEYTTGKKIPLCQVMLPQEDAHRLF